MGGIGSSKKNKPQGRGGDEIRPFAEEVFCPFIPTDCVCTWSYINTKPGMWRLKFRHSQCQSREHE